MTQTKPLSDHEKAATWFCESAEVQDLLERLRRVHRSLLANPPQYAEKTPTLLSHAADYANDLTKLRRYAGDVVARRMRMLFAAQLIKTSFFIDMYLVGLERSNPYSLFMACRAQIESHAVAWDAYRVLEHNAGDHPESFPLRVKTCDEVLIKAYFGSRTLQDFIKQIPGKSKMREFNIEDEVVFNAEQILNRIDKLSRTESFRYCREIYERVCEYLHPNMGQNIILAATSSKHSGREILSGNHPDTMKRAVKITLRAMVAAVEQSSAVVAEAKPPFMFCGTNVRITYVPFPKSEGPRKRNDPCFCGSGKKFKKCHGA